MRDIRYGKPSMTNLPYELGKAIFEEMDNSPPVDREAIQKEVDKLKETIKKAREKESR